MLIQLAATGSVPREALVSTFLILMLAVSSFLGHLHHSPLEEGTNDVKVGDTSVIHTAYRLPLSNNCSHPVSHSPSPSPFSFSFSFSLPCNSTLNS